MIDNIPPLPRGIAKWLLINTNLTVEQIAAFCGLHILEVEGMNEFEINQNISPVDPVKGGFLSQDEIHRCLENPSARLVMSNPKLKKPPTKKRYVPISKKKDKPDAIAWVLKSYPDVKISKLVKLFGTTKSTVENIKNKISEGMEINPRNPISLGLCSKEDLEQLII